MTDRLLWLCWLAGAYLLGAVPFGLLLGKAKGVDIRGHGSGNVGATNAGRVLGRKWGLLCFALDVVKGLGPVLGYGIYAGLTGERAASAVATLGWFAVAVAAVAGHIFPVYLKFKGGKGVATGFGVLLGIFPVLTAAGGAAVLLWLVVVRWSGYVSLASMVAAASLPVLSVGLGFAFGCGAGQMWVQAVVTAVLGALVLIRHRSNLKRLLAGTETKAAWATRSSVPD